MLRERGDCGREKERQRFSLGQRVEELLLACFMRVSRC
jgi:hypothetical protein